MIGQFCYAHVGKGRPFRPSLSGWTYSDLFGFGWIPNREAFAPLVQGVLVGFTFDKLSPYRDHSTSRGQGFGGNSPGRTLQETALVQIPGRVLPGSLRLERTGAGVQIDHIRWDLGGAIFTAVQ
jgi:hypothetical protein